MSHLSSLVKRFSSLRVFQDDTQMRFCVPIASDEILFEHSATPVERPAGELLEIVEAAFAGKFQLPVDPRAPGDAARSLSSHGPLATIEIWSLEPGSYDLVLRMPQHLAHQDSLVTPLIERFVDQAREITRTIDNLDLLRFQSGPTLSLKQAHQRLARLEEESGTRLDSDSLANLLNQKRNPLLN